MRFTEFPSQLPPALYDEAADAYATLVRRRTLALYRTGRISTPGISDLDLIVVPAVGPRYDNYAYFSLNRLPQRLQPVFRHPPFLLPYEARDAVLHSSHAEPVLLLGEDVLPRARTREPSAEERWSAVLDDYPRYRHFVDSAARTGCVHVRFLLSKVGSIRIPFENLDALPGPAAPALRPDTGLQRGQELRAGWFTDGATPEARAAEAWDVLRDLVDRFGRRIRDAAGIADDTEIESFSRAFLRGEPLIPGLDPARVLARQQALRRYHDAVGPLNIRCEPLVPYPMSADGSPEPWGRYLPARPVRALVRLQYYVDSALRGLRIYGDSATAPQPDGARVAGMVAPARPSGSAGPSPGGP